MMPESSVRDQILSRVRASLGRCGDAGEETWQRPEIPSTGRISRRAAGTPDAELRQLLNEITELSGQTRRLAGGATLAAALAELVDIEKVSRAAIWRTPELQSLGLAEILDSLGVEVAPPGASPAQIATCDLGITGVDVALPETGSLLLRSGPDRPRTVSLLPRVHLALVTPSTPLTGLVEALDSCRGSSCTTLISGPSRTSDIELTLTLGVHGPKALYVWVL